MIERPRPYVLEAMAARLSEEVGDLADKVRVVPSLKPRLDRARADLAAVQAELAGADAPPVEGTAADLDDLVTDEPVGDIDELESAEVA